MKANTYLIITRYLRSSTSDRRPYVTLACEYGCAIKSRMKSRVDDEEEEVHIKMRGPYETKNHDHAQAARLTEEQLIQNEQFAKSHVPPCNMLRFFREQNVGCAVSVQKIFNVVAKMKKNRMQGRNTVEELLCLSTQRSYTVFYRNCEDNIALSDIVVVHPTSIAHYQYCNTLRSKHLA
ncbi:hypothetical protein M9H77_21536 [Catharanthus roseus]|uniref:Uncharacterized protein n=1 Tax=Catharanthus roseus TaxID=4058 RepID=A0ACC0ARZ5_CATRO|nr:hypothetical protein M9H77_21536 [Catharanthus roseus]